MKYLIVGAGGVGGSAAAYLFSAGMDVTLALRGERYVSVSRDGLPFRDAGGDKKYLRLKTVLMGDIEDGYDVVIIAVKDYDLEAVCRSVREQVGQSAMVVPLMNGLTGGETVASVFQSSTVVDSCVYLTAYRDEDGCVVRTDSGFKIVLSASNDDRLPALAADLEKCGIKVKISDNVRLDKFLKYFFISPLSVCQAYYGVDCSTIRSDKYRQRVFAALSEELMACGVASGLALPENCVHKNVERLDKMPPGYYSSMAKDYLAGKRYERKIMLEDVLAMARKYAVEAPMYAECAKNLKEF